MSMSLFSRQSGSPGETLREWSSLVGIVTAIIGNIFISFALNIQRYAHIRLEQESDRQNSFWKSTQKKKMGKNYGTQNDVAEERARINRNAEIHEDEMHLGHAEDSAKVGDIEDDTSSLHSHSSSESTIRPSEKTTDGHAERKTYLKSPYWWGGIVLMTVGEAGNFLAYGFAPASIVSPLGVVALVSNCIIAPCLLKERFRQRDFWGVMIAIAGAVVIVLSAKQSEDKMGPSDVWAAITRWEFETYLGITAGLIIVLMWASERYGEKTILIDLGLVGLFGGYTALSTKGIASLLSDTLWRALTFPITYLLVVVLVVTALMQIRYVNRALQRFDSTQVIPIQFVLFTISVIVGSAILYRDFNSATGDRVGKFVGGCLLTFVGVYFITSGRMKPQSKELPDLEEDEENAIGLVDEEDDPNQASPTPSEHARRPSTNSIKFEDKHPPSSRRASKQQREAQKPSHTSTSTASAHDPSLSTTPPRRSLSKANPASSATRPSAQESSVSSPLLPSEATRASSGTSTPGTPSTPTAQMARPGSLSRRSVARLTPGPLMSPLSSSLSAVVADERRRAAGSAKSQQQRPRLSRLRKSKSSRGGDNGKGQSMDPIMTRGTSPIKSQGLGSDDVPEEAVADNESERPSAAGRSQSVGAALGGWWKKKNDKGKENAED